MEKIFDENGKYEKMKEQEQAVENVEPEITAEPLTQEEIDEKVKTLKENMFKDLKKKYGVSDTELEEIKKNFELDDSQLVAMLEK
jgi:protease II